MKLTKTSVKALKAPDPSGKQKLHFDDDLRGFGVLCSGRTSTKSYVVQRDLPGGKTRRVTIAPFNILSLDEARQKAAKLLLDMHQGIDPRAERKAKAAASAARQSRDITLRLAFEEFLANRPALRDKSKQSYSDGMKHLDSWLDRSLREISREMVERRHKEIAVEVEKRRGSRGASSANGAMRAFRAVWNFAADRRDLPPCPVKLRKQWHPEPRRESYVAYQDLSKFYAAVRALQNDVARDYLTLLLFTGMRRGEAASLRWSDVDLIEKVIRIPSERTKGGRGLALPMSDVIYDMLGARHEIGNLGGFVFPAASESGHIEEPKFPLQLIAKASGVKATCHDLRRTFLTIAEGCEISAYALKAIAGHSMGSDVTRGYLQLTPERLRAPMQQIADRIKGLCAQSDAKKVIFLR